MGSAKKSVFQLGMFTFPVKLEVAVDDESSGFRTVCTGAEGASHDVTRVKGHVDCPTCQRSETSVWGYSQRGVEVDGKLVLVTSEEIKAATGAPIKAMALAFHPREKVYAATVSGDSVQNVYPDKGGEKGYVALRDALRRNPGVVAVTVWAPSTKNALWVLEVVDERIVCSKRAWPEDVRPAPAIPVAEVTDAEATMLDTLVTMETTDFDVLVYRNAARDGMTQLVQSRLADADQAPAVTGTAPGSTDMLAALQATIDARKPKRAPRKTAARKPAAKRKPTKVTSAA